MPDSSNASLIISASALFLMILLWLPKGYLARKLDSSAMQGEAQCSLSCIQITVVLFIGALVYRLWKGGWWVDSATSLILGFLFGWEGFKMVRWVRNPDFTGGCCGHEHRHDVNVPKKQDDVQSLAEEGASSKSDRSLCECCSEKPDCKVATECICLPSADDKAVRLSPFPCTRLILTLPL